MTTQTNTFDGLLSSESFDWFAWPGHMSQAKALRTFLEESEDHFCSLLEDMPGSACETCGGSGDEAEDSMSALGIPGGVVAVGPCPTCKGDGWTRKPIAFLRKLAREIRAGWVRPVREGDEVPHLDGWYMECEKDDPKAEPAMIWTW